MGCQSYLCVSICSFGYQNSSNSIQLVIRPTTNAIMALTFANYVITPFFPDCEVPDDAVRLVAASAICKFLATFPSLRLIKFNCNVLFP